MALTVCAIYAARLTSTTSQVGITGDPTQTKFILFNLTETSNAFLLVGSKRETAYGAWLLFDATNP